MGSPSRARPTNRGRCGRGCSAHLDMMRVIRTPWPRRGNIADKSLADPSSVDHELAGTAFSLAAINGDAEFYDKVMAAMKNPKSPEEYYIYFVTLPQFDRSQAAAAHPGILDLAGRPVAGCSGTGDGSAWRIQRARSWLGTSSDRTGMRSRRRRAVCQRAGRGHDQRVLRRRNARPGDGVLQRSQGRGSGAHLQAVHRTHQQLRRSEIAAGVAAGLVAGTARKCRRKIERPEVNAARERSRAVSSCRRLRHDRQHHM